MRSATSIRPVHRAKTLQANLIEENEMNFEDFEESVLAWSTARGILQNGTVEGQTLKFCEEAGEVAGAVAKQNHELLLDSVGDVLVTLVNVCALSDIKFEDAMDQAWREIRDRKGYLTAEGVFVKESENEDIDNDYQGYPE